MREVLISVPCFCVLTVRSFQGVLLFLLAHFSNFYFSASARWKSSSINSKLKKARADDFFGKNLWCCSLKCSLDSPKNQRKRTILNFSRYSNSSSFVTDFFFSSKFQFKFFSSGRSILDGKLSVLFLALEKWLSGFPNKGIYTYSSRFSNS